MRAETLQLGARRGQVVVYRSGESGPPLVWLHSLYGPEADARIVDTLAESYSVYAPLAPGFADLEELDHIRDIHDLALHYDDVLEALGLASPIVAGHSFGAMIGVELAAHVPYRVHRLVLTSPLGLWNDDHPVADLFSVPAPEMPTLLYVDPSRAPGAGTTPDVEAIIALARGMATVARFLWPIPDRGLWRRLHRVRAPSLVVHGTEDRFVPCFYAGEFATRLPNATRELIPGAGHMLFVEAFDATFAAMAPFLQLQLQPHPVEATA
jgi:pimeloyl-ACP methyl ester carboxylesterase